MLNLVKPLRLNLFSAGFSILELLCLARTPQLKAGRAFFRKRRPVKPIGTAW